MFDIFTLAVSFLALISSVIIGRKQFELNRLQFATQDKVELYLLVQLIALTDVNGSPLDGKRPVIYIRNVGNNVVYLDKYLFNGREYPLGREVLPPLSTFDGYHYIFLPTDIPHVSFEIDFYDWRNRSWKTKGYADFQDGIWKITYSPCEQKM